MPDDVTPAEEAPEPGDLTARLRSLEERISGEIAPARRRRTPADPSQRYVPPPLAADDPLADALDENRAPATDETPAEPSEEPAGVAPEEPGPAEPQADPEPEPGRAPEPEPLVAEEAAPAPARRSPVKKAAPRTAEPDAELGSGAVAAAAVAAASSPPVARPVKRAPAKKAAVKAAAKKAPAKKAPATKAGAKRPSSPVAVAPWPVSDTGSARPMPSARPATPRPAAVPVAKAPVPVPAAEPVLPARKGDVVVRVLLTLTVLLLAAAAGLGAAAFVENRDATFAADVVVRLDPGNDPQGSIDAAVAAAMPRYLQQTGEHAFTVTAAQRASVATSDVRSDVRPSQTADRQITLAVRASTAAGTTALAGAAGDALVELVNLDQASNVTSAGDRLSAAVERPPGKPTKTAPKDRDAYAAGGLAAGAVLLLSGVGALLRFTRHS